MAVVGISGLQVGRKRQLEERIRLTLNTYSHVLPDMSDAAAGGMDAALG